jgi:hypothetical protein
VQSPQPACNANQTLNQKWLFLHKVMEDEVVGLASLLLLIWNFNRDPIDLLVPEPRGFYRLPAKHAETAVLVSAFGLRCWLIEADPTSRKTKHRLTMPLLPRGLLVGLVAPKEASGNFRTHQLQSRIPFYKNQKMHNTAQPKCQAPYISSKRQ